MWNPTICGMMFFQAVAGPSRSEQIHDATKATLTVLVILVVAALIGTQLLHLFGVSLDAFMVAGGGVLAWMGFSMLRGQQTESAPPSAGSNADPSLTPLILFATSPGAIIGLITISAGTPGYGPGSHRCRDYVYPIIA